MSWWWRYTRIIQDPTTGESDYAQQVSGNINVELLNFTFVLTLCLNLRICNNFPWAVIYFLYPFMLFGWIIHLCDHFNFFMHSYMYSLISQVWSSIQAGCYSITSDISLYLQRRPLRPRHSWLVCTRPFKRYLSGELCFHLIWFFVPSPVDSERALLHRQPPRTAILFFYSSPIFPPSPLPPHNYWRLCPQPIALKVHSMSSLTHLRRHRKERGCHWDNTRRNKVMFRGKHSLGIVLYLCSLTHFLFLLFLFLLFRQSPPWFSFVVCLCFVCLMTPSLFCVPCFFCFFCISSGNESFIPSEIQQLKVWSCAGSDCCRLRL